jgi:hypothetical protein
LSVFNARKIIAFSMQGSLQRSFRNVKVFEGTIEFFHDVLQINVTAANPPPPNEHMTFLVDKIDTDITVCEASLLKTKKKNNFQFLFRMNQGYK